MPTDDTFWFVQARSGGHWIEPLAFDLADRCPEGEPDGLDREVARGDFGVTGGPPSFVVDKRGKPNDFLWALGAPYKVVSGRVVDVLADQDATGWSVTPVDIRFKNGEELDGYHLLMVTGACDDFLASHDPSTRYTRSGMILANGVDVTEGWDGSDVFYTRGGASCSMLITDRLLQEFEAAELTGHETTRSTDFEVILGYDDDRPRGGRLHRPDPSERLS